MRHHTKVPYHILQVYDIGTVHLQVGAVERTVNLRRLTPYTSAPLKADTVNHGGECSMQTEIPRRAARKQPSRGQPKAPARLDVHMYGPTQQVQSGTLVRKGLVPRHLSGCRAPRQIVHNVQYSTQKRYWTVQHVLMATHRLTQSVSVWIVHEHPQQPKLLRILDPGSRAPKRSSGTSSKNQSLTNKLGDQCTWKGQLGGYISPYLPQVPRLLTRPIQGLVKSWILGNPSQDQQGFYRD